MPNHTPEPWSLQRDYNGHPDGIVAGKSDVVQTICYEDHSEIDWTEADARRIVACVNFMQGTDTETIEQYLADNTIYNEGFEYGYDNTREGL